MGEQVPIGQRVLEARRRWPFLTFDKKNSNEASADGCPFCSMVDDDGFLIFAAGNYFCRKCGAKGFIDENDPKPPSTEEIREMRLRRLERKVEEQEKRLALLEEMHNCEDHLRYHENLNDHTRQLWYESGIYDEAIDKFQLGYTSQCPTWRSSPSLTIPVYSYENQLVNIRHRLLKPNGGKYRPHRKGLGSQLFHASLLRESHERLLVLEGEKKVICLDQAGFPAVGIMGKSVWKRAWFEWFDVGRIYIALDPDADESAERLAQIFADNGFDDVYIADFPAKPDDLLVKYGAGERHIERILELARPVR